MVRLLHAVVEPALTRFDRRNPRERTLERELYAAELMADWSTIASLATAGGTLVLAVATFSSVRFGQRSARVAERSTAIAERALLLGLRPVLAPSRVTDPPEIVRFGEGRMVSVEGGVAAVERDGENYYFVIPLRNVGNGLAVLQAGRPSAQPPEREAYH